MRCPLPGFRTRIGGERSPTLPLGRRRRAASCRSLRVSRSIRRPLRTFERMPISGYSRMGSASRIGFPWHVGVPVLTSVGNADVFAVLFQVLYCNPGYAVRINELPEADSDEMLEFLFTHQLQMKFRYTHVWTENDVLLWDHLGTIHRAIADYRPDEIRLIRRCQVMATKVFDPAFLQPARELAAREAALDHLICETVSG